MNLHQGTLRRGVTLSACAIVLLATGACGGADPGADPNDATGEPSAPGETSSSSPASSTPSPETAASPTPDEPRLIDYTGGGSGWVEVQDRSDVDKLDGAPEDFKDFIARTVEGLDGASCDAAATGVQVKTLRTDGYAVGSVSECGGYVAMWAVVDGEWKEIQGTQDMWRCGVLERYRVPSDVAGPDCYDAQAKEVRDYSQA